MSEPWYTPQTQRQRVQYDQACKTLYEHFGSYPKIAAFLKEETGEYIAAQTVRMWFKDRRIPAHNAMLLTRAIDLNPFHLLPWLHPFIVRWMIKVKSLKESVDA